MPKIFLFLSLITICSFADSQTIGITYNNIAYEITYDTVVEDSTGKPYPSETWVDLFMNGEYRLVPKNPENKNTPFFLEKLSPEDQAMFNSVQPEESRSFNRSDHIHFKGKDINGKKVDSDDLRGKIVVLNFWFINCPPCKREIPYLNKIVKEYEADSSIVFVSIATDGKKELEKFLQKTPFNYTILVNGGMHTYKIDIYPTHVILDKEGKVRFHTVGYSGRTGHWIRKTIDEIKINK